MFIGSQHVEQPFILIGQIGTSFYFAWFLIIVPAIGIVENTLLDIATESNSTESNTIPALLSPLRYYITRENTVDYYKLT
jgi:hypothetical protein